MNPIVHTYRLSRQANGLSKPAQPGDRVETAARVLSTLLLVGGVLGGAVLFLRAEPTRAARQVGPAAVVAQTTTPVKYTKPNSAVATSSPHRAWVDPPPLPSAEQPQVATPPTSPGADPKAVAQAVSARVPGVATDCLPTGLLTVIKDVEGRFGPATLISTTELHTDNHSPGSMRHKIHAACKAIDFRVQGDRKAVVAYLRFRPEVAGLNSYGNNGVIHIDTNDARQVAQR